jgi:hypothetical protein
MQDLDWLHLSYLHFLLTARATASFVTSRPQRLKFSWYALLAAVNLSIARTISVPLTTTKVYGYTFSRFIGPQRMIFLWLFNLVILSNIKNRAPNDTVSHPRGLHSSAVPQCKPQFLQSTQVSLFIVPLVPFPYSVSLRWSAGILNIRVQE